MSKQNDMTYKQRIREYHKNPTLCYFCNTSLPYSDLRPLSAVITRKPEICNSPECIEKYQNFKD